MPAPYRPREDEIDRGVRGDLDRLEREGRIGPVGNDGPRIFPVTHAEAHGACPFTAGYWNWLDRNASRLEGNRRMSRPLGGLRRLGDRADVVAQEKHREHF